jgi:peroxiredoxin
MTDSALSLRPAEGLAVLHLFYRINRPAWDKLPEERRQKEKSRLEDLVVKARAEEQTQLVTLAMLGRADLGFMLIAPDLHRINTLEKQLASSLGPDVLQPVYTYLSLTEKSEYTQTEAEYTAELAKETITAGHPEFEAKIAAFRQRYHSYTHDRMYPTLPDWEYFCFYPMNKKREPGQNWYALDFAKRRELMGGHARVGRKYAGKVRQLITGSTGLDDWEWGVTLFAHDPAEIKAIVYEMRFDEVSHGYAQFGPFYNGLPLPLPQLYQRLLL